MVGAPGAGKSSGHRYMIENDLLEEGNYATINLDTLLESLTPFRTGSVMGYTVSKMFPNIKFSSIGSYQSKKENVGAFGWYNTARPMLEERDPDLVGTLNAIRSQYAHLTDKEKSRSLITKNDAALQRAVSKGVDIVYETTLSVGSGGRITKVDELMPLLAEKGYTVKIVHVTASPKNIAARVTARQEHGMPYEERPFYRVVPAFLTSKLVAGTAEGVAAIAVQYPDTEIITIENPADPTRIPPVREFIPANMIGRIMAAYPPRDLSSERATSSEVRRTAKKNSGATGAGAKPKRTYTRRKAGGKKKSSSSSASD
jgi:hypothetical protein